MSRSASHTTLTRTILLIFLLRLRNQVTVPVALVPAMTVLVAAATVPAIQARAVTAATRAQAVIVLTVPAVVTAAVAVIDK